MPTHKKYTLKNRCKPDHEPKFLREYFFATEKRILKFFPTLKKKIKTPDTQAMTTKFTADRHQHNTTEKEGYAGNSTLPKVAVSFFVGQFCGYKNFSASYESEC